MLSVLGALPLVRVQVWAQAALFPGEHEGTLNALGAAVLPEGLGERGEQAVAQFVQWVRGYREQAEMSHGYGVTALRITPASPVGAYHRQLAEFEAAARDRGGRFADLPRDVRRSLVVERLTAANVQTMPSRPTGQHVASDLMGHFFGSSYANDLCHGAAIGRGRCRTLEGSEEPPPPLAGGR
jgi:hypothetical protein